jgi:hypothetical protein
MRKLARGALVAVIAAALLMTLPATGALASTGPTYFSSDQAGYAVAGSGFNETEIWVTLPDAARFSRELGSVGISLQLWNKQTVATLTISACTDPSCRPGGKPARLRYRANFSIFKASTHALICSTSSSNPYTRCQGVSREWSRLRFRAGQQTYLVLSYDRMYGDFQASAGGTEYTTSEPGVSKRFDQARIVAQFGATPWSASYFRPPARAMHVMTMGVPPPPPWAGEVSAYSPSPPTECIGNWPRHHHVAMTALGRPSRRPRAIASGTWLDGCDFSISLEP